MSAFDVVVIFQSVCDFVWITLPSSSSTLGTLTPFLREHTSIDTHRAIAAQQFPLTATHQITLNLLAINYIIRVFSHSLSSRTNIVLYVVFFCEMQQILKMPACTCRPI